MNNIFQKIGMATTITTPLNNMTDTSQKRRIGRSKNILILEQTYRMFLKDEAIICNIFRNKDNTSKNLPALERLLVLLNNKYNRLLEGAYGEILEFHMNALWEELEAMKESMDIKLYSFSFSNGLPPIVVIAMTMQAAKADFLKHIALLNKKGYSEKLIAEIEVIFPITGETSTVINDMEYVWGQDGWILK